MASNSNIIHVPSEAEYHRLLATDKLVVVDYFADWCGPCRVISPKFEALSIQYPDVVFLKVNVEEIPSLKPFALPTFKFYQNNSHVGTVVGANEALLKRGLDNNGQVSFCNSVCMIQ